MKTMVVAGQWLRVSSSEAFASTEYMANSESLDLNMPTSIS